MANTPLLQRTGAITTQNLVASGDATAASSVEVATNTIGVLTIQVFGTYTASGGLSGQITTDGIHWVTLGGSSTFTRQSTGASSATITSAEQDIYQVSAITGAVKFRVVALGAVTGTATITIQPVELAPGGSSGSGIGSGSGGNGTAATSSTITTQNLVPAGTATASSSLELDARGLGAFVVQVTGTYTGALSAQVTVDGTNWITLASTAAFVRESTGLESSTIASGVQDIFELRCPTGVNKVRISALAAVTGTATVSIRASVPSAIKTTYGQIISALNVLLAGEDQTLGLLRGGPVPNRVQISAAATTTVKVGKTAFYGIEVVTGGAGSVVTVYDQTSATGDKIIDAASTATSLFVPIPLDVGRTLNTGLTVVTSGGVAAVINVYYI